MATFKLEGEDTLLGLSNKVSVLEYYRFSAKGRRTQIVELIKKHNVDEICLQETIKRYFTYRELNSLSYGRQFWWSWIPATGHSGGLLVGINEDRFDIISKQRGEFSQSVRLKYRENDVNWELVNVYGPI